MSLGAALTAGSLSGAFGEKVETGAQSMFFGEEERVRRISAFNPQQERVMRRLSSRLNRPYSGPFVAPMSQYERQGLGWLGQYLGDQGGTLSAQIDAYRRALSGEPLGSRELFEQGVLGPAERRYREETQPSIAEAFGGPGTYWTSARAQAQQRGAEVFGEQMAGLEYGALQDAATRQMQALGMTPPEISATEAALKYGGLPRQLAQADLDARWMAYQQYVQNSLSFLGLNAENQLFIPRVPSIFEQAVRDIAGSAGEITAAAIGAGGLGGGGGET